VSATYDVDVSDAARDYGAGPSGTSLLPPDLTADQLASAPILLSLDALRIEGLTADEFEAFAAALRS